MFRKSISTLGRGSSIADMHNHWQTGVGSENPFHISEPHVVTQRIVVPCPDPDKVVNQLVGRGTCNKDLYIVQVQESFSKPVKTVTAAWSYDGMYFGMIVIEVQVEE